MYGYFFPSESKKSSSEHNIIEKTANGRRIILLTHKR